MARNIKSKEIQVQKPAQSLKAFQAKLEQGNDLQVGIMKPLLIAAGAVVVIVLGGFAFTAYRSNRVENHETAVASLLQEVRGTSPTPPTPAEVQQRMRTCLPRLQALAQNAPGSTKASTQGLLNTWTLALNGKDTPIASSPDAWSQLRLAQRQIAMGQSQQALATLAPLRHSATPSEPWGNLFWSTQIDARRLEGNRQAAWMDFAEYKNSFREQAADTSSMERMINGI
jgi:predicted negative regulator of RcsB-dependent stress response